MFFCIRVRTEFGKLMRFIRKADDPTANDREMICKDDRSLVYSCLVCDHNMKICRGLEMISIISKTCYLVLFALSDNKVAP